jgi:putative ABC transport system permease protein
MSQFWHVLKEQLARIRASLGCGTLDADFDEEVEAHLALLTERFVRRGLNPDAARYAARRQFGGVTQMKSELRDGSRFRPLEALLQDSAYVVRQCRKSPLFAMASILTLALGIGANTAIFTLVDQLILRLLPIQDPQRVVALVGQGQFYGDNMGENPLSYTMYQTIRDRNQVFSRMMCRRPMPFTATVHSESDVLSGELVSGNYFPLLGIRAATGRVIDSNDDLHPGAAPVAVLSYAYWKSRFAASDQIIGRTILVNNYPLTIVGVSQSGFNGLEPGLPSQIFVPVMMTPALFPEADFSNMFNSRLRWLNVYGRLKAGMTRERAKAGLQPLFHQILQAEMLQPGFTQATPYDKQEFLRMWLDVIPGGQGNSTLRQQYEKPVWVLMGVTGFVLLIACANLASLLAARAVVRQKEIAVRLAIGSSRARIIQQLMTESLLLALVGGIVGIGLAIVMVENLLTFLPEIPTGYAISSSPDLRILCFALGLSLLTGFIFGLIPARQAARGNLADTLKAKAASVTGATSQINFRKVLVTAQITLSLLLLIGASLFIRSLANLRSVNPGFHTENLVQFDMDLSSIGYEGEQAHAFYSLLETRLAHLPGVNAAGIATNPVLADSDWESTILVEGHENKPGEQTHAYVNRVSPGYFKTLGIHLLSGRTFRESDTVKSPKVVVVSDSFARHYFGQQSAIGHWIGRGYEPNTPTDLEIVGVVNDIDYQDLRQKESRQVYLCAPQGSLLDGTVYLNVEGNPRGALAIARRVVHEMEPKAPVMNMKTVEHQLEESLVTERMIASLSTVFTILAVALAVLGLYGVMGYMVTQRAREIGIRVALGAQFGNVVWLVMREVVLLVITGIAIGVPLALGLARFIQSEVYGISPTDPRSIAAAAGLLSGIALLAAFVPARRAALADPLQVLRYE